MVPTVTTHTTASAFVWIQMQKYIIQDKKTCLYRKILRIFKRLQFINLGSAIFLLTLLWGASSKIKFQNSESRIEIIDSFGSRLPDGQQKDIKPIHFIIIRTWRSQVIAWRPCSQGFIIDIKPIHFIIITIIRTWCSQLIAWRPCWSL